ncbi:hypothetical protein SLEP1_g23798 [Rubroshorea leprosula]|uniref:Uncharacterized protein n=1 Tax=Rubroshorea leprosula TaxID=152421 RepID=A0AAV5JMT6_9ROSI|nr:hypothetical protein SLEP1_g23798 [Rubroshorea leprosula]
MKPKELALMCLVESFGLASDQNLSEVLADLVSNFADLGFMICLYFMVLKPFDIQILVS